MLRRVTAGLAAAGFLLAGATPAAAESYTNQFRGDGSSDFGLAWMHARWQAEDKAIADGFTDPDNQCEEIFSFGDYYTAMVIWDCTREV
ncbi:hypothetical protein [Actinophytocola sp.]|uniref:hypothetical protein n=1 Tax=Actinophytocola sp. TaxID=1872138 RepID=UPI002ED58D83